MGGFLIVIDESFFVPRQMVSVVSLGDSGEALLIRAILESLGAAVTLHLPGTPADFLLTLTQPDTPPVYLVICAHGTDDGFVLGAYGPGIETSMLVHGCLPPAALDRRVTLPGAVVVSTACGSGSEAFGRAFVAGQVAAYVAPHGSPDSAEAALFIHRLFYALLRRKASLQQALEAAEAADATFVGFFQRD